VAGRVQRGLPLNALDEVHRRCRPGHRSGRQPPGASCIGGIGIALLPSGLVREPLNRGELIPVLPEYRLNAGGFYVVLPTRRHVPAAVRHFMQFALAKFEKEDRFSLNNSEPARRLSGTDKKPSAGRRSSSGVSHRPGRPAV